MNTSNNQALKQYFKQYLTEVRGVSERTVSHDNTSLRTVERSLHFARRADRQPVLSSLYTARADRLHHSGIDVSHDEFIGLET